MSSKHIRQFWKRDRKSAELLKKAMNSLGFSARAYDRILKVARTITDPIDVGLEKVVDIGADHIAEAIQYRSFDKEGGSYRIELGTKTKAPCNYKALLCE